MKRELLCIIFLLLLACQKEEREPVAPARKGDVTRLRVKVTEELAAQVEAARERGEPVTRALETEELEGLSLRRTFPPSGRFESRARAAGLHLWYDVLPDTPGTLTRTGEGLAATRGVVFVEHVPEVTSHAIPPSFNDERLSIQLSLYNDGTLQMASGKSVAGCDINVTGVWKNYTTGSPEVIVAIMDGGIDYRHEDLAANMWVNEAEARGLPGVDDDRNGYVDDVHGFNFLSMTGEIIPERHGTIVAGIVAAVSNNGKGIAGVAGGDGTPGSGARLMSCQLSEGEERRYENPAAFIYAADNGAVILQCSWGYTSTPPAPIQSSLKDAIDYFVRYAGTDENGNQTGPMKGGVVFFSAGNDNSIEVEFPATYEKVIAVGSIGADFQRASYSNYGPAVNIVAPGGDRGRIIPWGGVMSTAPGNLYEASHGTSLACPHLSGVAALLVSYHGTEGFTAAMLRERLEATAVNIDAYNPGYEGWLGKGLVNALGAMEYGKDAPPPAPVADLSARGESNTITLSWTIPANPVPGGFQLFCREGSLDGISLDHLPSDVITGRVATGSRAAGERVSYTFTGLEFGKSYRVAARAYDFYRHYSPLSPPLAITTEQNEPPRVATPLEGLVIKRLTDEVSVNLDDYFADANAEVLTYLVEENLVPAVATVVVDGSFLRVTPLKGGTTRVTVRATDGAGQAVATSFPVIVRETPGEVDLYPNPVTSLLNLRVEGPVDCRVTIYSAAGARVMERRERVDLLAPCVLDLSALPGGAYHVVVAFDGKEVKRNILKL